MATHYIQDIAVEVSGEPVAGTVLMLHGMGASSNVWLPILPVFSKYRVIRPDLPGAARSSAASPTAPLTIERMAAAMRDVCAALQADRVHVVAHAMGTLVALHLARLEPARVRSLFLLSPTQGPLPSHRPALFKRAQMLRRRELDLPTMADHLIPALLSQRVVADDPVCVALLRETLMHQTPDGYARTLIAWANAQPARVDAIDCPTLLIAGEEDPFCSGDDVARLADSMPHARGAVLSNCGHTPMLERVGATSSALRRFYA